MHNTVTVRVLHLTATVNVLNDIIPNMVHAHVNAMILAWVNICTSTEVILYSMYVQITCVLMGTNWNSDQQVCAHVAHVLLDCDVHHWCRSCMCELALNCMKIYCSVLDLAKNLSLETSLKSGSQKAPELPLDLTLYIVTLSELW